MNDRVYAIIEGYIDDEFSLVLVDDPNIYKDQEVVFTYIDREVPTKFYEMLDLLEEWTPYSGEFTIGGEYGNINSETGEFEQNEDYESDWFDLIATYKDGEKISERYEKG